MLTALDILVDSNVLTGVCTSVVGCSTRLVVTFIVSPIEVWVFMSVVIEAVLTVVGSTVELKELDVLTFEVVKSVE